MIVSNFGVDILRFWSNLCPYVILMIVSNLGVHILRFWSNFCVDIMRFGSNLGVHI